VKPQIVDQKEPDLSDKQEFPSLLSQETPREEQPSSQLSLQSTPTNDDDFHSSVLNPRNMPN